MEVSGQFHAPAAVPHGKSPWHPLDRRLGGPQSRSGRGGEEKNSQPLPELEPPIKPPIAQRYTNSFQDISALKFRMHSSSPPSYAHAQHIVASYI
jgi:hypothetical protein